jgi:hypothetical protein
MSTIDRLVPDVDMNESEIREQWHRRFTMQPTSSARNKSSGSTKDRASCTSNHE